MKRSTDDSAINVRLTLSSDASFSHYFKEINSIKNEIKCHLREKLNIHHDHIFFLNNSTHCLLNVLYGLVNFDTHLSIDGGCYKPYAEIDVHNGTKSLNLVTHISPDSGKVSDFNSRVVLDAAQSAGTICHHQRALSADIVFFPLHKHLALQTGIGVLCINYALCYQGIIKIAKLSESGTVNDQVFIKLIHHIRSHSISFNVGIFNLTKHQIDELSLLGVASLTPALSRTPFVVLESSIDLDRITPFSKSPFSIRKQESNRYRISCYCEGSPSSNPVDYSKKLVNIFRRVL